jgi:hypothetical protein
MNPYLFLLLTWIFYLAERHTSDPIWMFCMVYSGILAICAYIYRKEVRPRTPQAKPGGRVAPRPRSFKAS